LWQDPKINVLLEEAGKALGDLNAFSKLMPNIDTFIEMHVKLEANKNWIFNKKYRCHNTFYLR